MNILRKWVFKITEEKHFWVSKLLESRLLISNIEEEKNGNTDFNQVKTNTCFVVAHLTLTFWPSLWARYVFVSKKMFTGKVECWWECWKTINLNPSCLITQIIFLVFLIYSPLRSSCVRKNNSYSKVHNYKAAVNQNGT